MPVNIAHFLGGNPGSAHWLWQSHLVLQSWWDGVPVVFSGSAIGGEFMRIFRIFHLERVFWCILLMEEILHQRGHIWQYIMICTSAPPFQCCVFWRLVRRCRISVIQLLCFGDSFFLPMLSGEHEGLHFWKCRIFSIHCMSLSDGLVENTN